MITHYKYGTSLKIKRDICVDCGKERPIYSLKRCMNCYKVHNNKARQDKRREREPEENKDVLWNWFCDRLKECKNRCEETGDRINMKEGKEHYAIAHVLPKSLFPSVATHPLNWIELSWQSHSDFDYYLDTHDERLMQMRIFEKVVSIIQQLKPFVKESRRLNNLPEFILNKIA